MDFELPPLEITLEDEPPARDLQSLLNGLLSFNRTFQPDPSFARLAVLVRDAAGCICAGLTGSLFANALAIEYVWVEETLRRRGIGSLLLATAEAHALQTGNWLAHLESMSFQAPAFYTRHGYHAYAQVDGYPDGVARIHLSRALSAADGALPTVNPLVSSGLHLEVHTEPAAADLRTVQDQLLAWNAQVYRPDDPHPLNVLVRGPGGQLLGGLTATTYWNACFVDILWLDFALRRRGIGSAVMAAAEVEAARRGCAFVHLDTLSFQARGFYEKLGYAVYGTLGGFAGDVNRYHLVKRLRTQGAETGRS